MLEGSILRRLDEAHRDGKQPLNLGVYYKNTLVALCHALEDFILDSDSAPIAIAAFQRGKWYLEEADRYSDLADKAQHVVILATAEAGFDSHPTSEKDNVKLVDLKPEDPVAEEWHLMIISSTYTAMVLCQELSDEDYGDNKPKEDLERKFYGFWTFEPALVRETVDLTIDHIKGYQPELAKLLTEKVAQMTDEHGIRQRDDLDAVVTQVIEYLQDSQKNLHHPNKASTFNVFKDLDENIISNEMQAFLRMAQLLDATDVRNPMAASEVAAMAEAMAQLLDLPAWQAKRLYISGLLHRVGLPEVMKDRNKQSKVQKEALNKTDSASKASVLRVMPQLEAISKILTHQREAWDGSGIPSRLAYDAIPLESRIICLLADFQQKMKAYKQYSSDKNPITNALADCQALAGKRYDPKLLDALSLLVMGMQQGMTLQAYRPKIATGMWLINSGNVNRKAPFS
ncbi:metal-dependent phosphohydrolase [Waterburya agarophytonicola K14]|uniref:Metal-dependent phosphohydrolase n=1 Tax=Waterburya agarophytonicola KI4 TaxID=2874699 RepID=A0A964BNU5_9CYAN|nr:DICT sensory domain-containing protein [Waterburya agarophytonicola]MCC0176853.1 metal-dependent phosphohydrolase [Waterburya agarophytonicola KI4]